MAYVAFTFRFQVTRRQTSQGVIGRDSCDTGDVSPLLTGQSFQRWRLLDYLWLGDQLRDVSVTRPAELVQLPERIGE